MKEDKISKENSEKLQPNLGLVDQRSIVHNFF